MKIKKTIAKLLAGAVSVFSIFGVCLASGCPQLIMSKTEGSDMKLYFYSGNTEDGSSYNTISDVSCQIGTSLCDSELSEITDIRTVILVDNSLEMYSSLISHELFDEEFAQASIETPLHPSDTEGVDYLTPFLKQFTAGHADNESFRVATMGGGLTYLTDFSTDYAGIDGLFDGITYSYCDTPIIDSLYSVLSDLSDSSSYFTRVVVISDFVDNSSGTYSYNDIAELSESLQIPIYMAAVSYGANDESLSSASPLFTAELNTECATVDGTNLSDFYANTINRTNNLSLVTVHIPSEILNGSTMGILVNFTTLDGEFTYTGSVTTPIIPVTPSPIPTSTPVPVYVSSETLVTETTAETSEETYETMVVGDKDEENSDNGNYLIWFFLVAVFIVCVVVFCIKKETFKEFFERVRKKETSSASYRAEPVGNISSSTQSTEKQRMRVKQRAEERAAKENRIDPNVPVTYKNVGEITFYDLTGNNESYTLQVKDEMTIGKGEGCTLRLKDGALSQVQCRIFRRDGGWYLENMNQVNPTRYNETPIRNQAPMISGGTLTLGQKAFRVTFRDT